jgi:hypothetical protein
MLTGSNNALARITSFRDVLLDRQPILLDAFLEQALVAGESEVGALCGDVP